jgi:hypothetical protein
MTNAAALLGVAYNRSGEPESLLQLTQRELSLPYGWGLEGENSGIALALQWRVLQAERGDSLELGVSYPGHGAPEWLDAAKLAALGFDVSPSAVEQSKRHQRQLPREVLLVLELDGPAYQEALRRARAHAEREAGLLTAKPANEEFKRRAEQAREQLDEAEQRLTRLFIVDAGLDAAALRADYPDRSRYALVAGRVRPYLSDPGYHPQLQGHVAGLVIDRITVPHAFRRVFEPLLERYGAKRFDASLRYTAFVAFGKRFEPWITGVIETKPN